MTDLFSPPTWLPPFPAAAGPTSSARTPSDSTAPRYPVRPPVFDDQLCALLNSHPVTSGVLVRLGLYRDQQWALHRLQRLVDRHQAWRVGYVSGPHGGHEVVFCRWKPREWQLPREVALTELLLRLDLGTYYRGPKRREKRFRPDAEVQIEVQPYVLEVDRGVIGDEQMGRHLRAYEAAQMPSLWICGTAERMQQLQQLAERLRKKTGHALALFTTQAEALRDPYGLIWRDCRGSTVRPQHVKVLHPERSTTPSGIPWLVKQLRKARLLRIGERRRTAAALRKKWK